MFNTNNTLEQKVMASMESSLHRVAFIEHFIIIGLSEPHLQSRTDAITLSGFTAAFSDSCFYMVARLTKISITLGRYFRDPLRPD